MKKYSLYIQSPPKMQGFEDFGIAEDKAAFARKMLSIHLLALQDFSEEDLIPFIEEKNER